VYGIVSFKPIINTDQAAILAMGKITLTAVADESNNLHMKPMMNLSLGCDHRIVDGADGAKFLSELKEMLERLKEGTDA
jgi:pyruvate dehydrogenase E2 component (dihydrolipoamide acetyltransferase)